MTQPTTPYMETTRKFVEKTGKLAMPIARELGVSPTAIIGAVANEYDTRKQWGWGVQAGADVWARMSSFGPYPRIPKQRIEPSSGKPGVLRKIVNPFTIDIGPGNIRVDAAISMVQDYVERHKKTKKDPLGLLKYRNDYDSLVNDLLNFENPKASYAIAGLFLAEGQKLLKQKSRHAWDKLSPDQKDALLVTYFKIGKEQIERNIDKRLNAPNRSPGDFAYNPRGDGGQQHLNNADNLRKWLRMPRMDYPTTHLDTGPKQLTIDR
ncbi:hypothetical protein [Hoeflea prorocentri]|uniref:Uncharacterized protein n=1 Tax=Hoeflea prorocentri TaxID=1922333 RepID=A0A9X3ZHQ4_9HYPH|nr:hypothetical protein [Hoeflea prorocentri]MCY6380985.1 hypothetical protein [Hoeflea prorocentri]MDA5398785.1 hypothetical protein [Hoeflea prorocentri]